MKKVVKKWVALVLIATLSLSSVRPAFANTATPGMGRIDVVSDNGGDSYGAVSRELNRHFNAKNMWSTIMVSGIIAGALAAIPGGGAGAQAAEKAVEITLMQVILQIIKSIIMAIVSSMLNAFLTTLIQSGGDFTAAGKAASDTVGNSFKQGLISGLISAVLSCFKVSFSANLSDVGNKVVNAAIGAVIGAAVGMAVTYVVDGLNGFSMYVNGAKRNMLITENSVPTQYTNTFGAGKPWMFLPDKRVAGNKAFNIGTIS